MNESHQPPWLAELAESVTSLMHAHDVLAPVGCHFHEEDDLWEVMVFVSRTEVYGGRRDGRQLPSRFTLDVQGVIDLFASIEAVEWQALPQGGDDEAGANFAIVGIYDEQRICLRIPAKAPQRFQPGRIVDVHEGRFINLW